MNIHLDLDDGCSSEFLALKHESWTLGHASNPICGFSVMEQVRLCAVWPTENCLGRVDDCLIMLQECFRKSMFVLDWTGQDFRSHVRGSRREGALRKGGGRGNGKSTAAPREDACCILMEEGLSLSPSHCPKERRPEK